MSKPPTDQLARVRQQKQKSKISELSKHGIKNGTIDPKTLKRTSVAVSASAFGKDFTEEALSRHENHKSPSWEELQGVGNSIGRGIYEFACAVGENAKVVGEHGKSDAIFNNVVKTAMDDCVAFSNTVADIKKQHEGREGDVITSEDFELYYRLGGDYNNVWERFQTASFQATSEITSHLSALTSKLNADQNLEKITEDVLKNTVESENTIASES